MPENGLITCYSYDDYGYFKSKVIVQVLNGKTLMPSKTVSVSPGANINAWYKINDIKNGWIEEVKPSNAQECLGITVKHNDNSARAIELRKLMQSFCEADSEHYRVKRNDDLSLTVEEIPEKTLDDLKSEKLIQISEEAGKYDQYKCDTMFIISSVDGLKINSDARSQNNIRALIEHYTDLVTFKTYDNNYVQLTKEQLETMLTECILNGESLYAQKWALQDKVNNAQSKEDLDAIEIIFNMTDFSQSEL